MREVVTAVARVQGEPTPPRVTEEYGRTATDVWRQVTVGPWSGPRLMMVAKPKGESKDSLRSAWDRAWLRGRRPVTAIAGYSGRKDPIRVVDLFAGCGAMSLGLKTAAESLGMPFEALLAADADTTALGTYRQNFRPIDFYEKDLSLAISYQLSSDGGSFTREPSLVGSAFDGVAGKVDVLIGGPPCQGHSDLNNHSRRNDPRNSLYLLMAAFARALAPSIVIIENVPSVVHDEFRVVEKTTRLLSAMGFHVASRVIAIDQLGIAQRRRRHVLVATKGTVVDLESIQTAFSAQPRSVCWAIADLARAGDPASIFDSASVQTVPNRRRIDWLFDHDEYDLPNRRRPKCHRTIHSYKSMYGRMHWGKPAQAITSGYGSPGQGRYIHPRSRRTITPHEAARLQGFPDHFEFNHSDPAPLRTQLSRMIANAVPPKLTYVVGLRV